MIDSDSGFVTVLSKRAEAAGWQLRHLAGAIPPEELVAMKLNALLIDPAMLGDEGWEYLERVCGMLPDLGVSSAPAARPSPSGSAGCASGSTTGSPSPAIPRRRWPGSKRSRAAAAAAAPRPRPGPLVAGELEIRADQFQAFVGGDSLDLTRREFELLQLLAEAKGQVLERETIYQRVWGYAMAHGDRSVDVFIRKLRQKLEKRSPGWGYIHTHFGVGYRFDPEPVGGAGRCSRPPPSRSGGRAGAGFTSRSQQLHRRITATSPSSPCSAIMAIGSGQPRSGSTGAWRSGPRSTPRWSTAGR